jgi:hypothetical protein
MLGGLCSFCFLAVKSLAITVKKEHTSKTVLLFFVSNQGFSKIALIGFSSWRYTSMLAIVMSQHLICNNGESKTSNVTEVFENEEAAKFLDYFVAYRKMMSKVEDFKRIAKVNSEIKFFSNTFSMELNELFVSQVSAVLPMPFEK